MSKDNCKNCGKHKSELNEPPWAIRLPDNSWGIICKQCWEVEIEKQIKEFQESEKNTTCEIEIICPFCGYANDTNHECYDDGEHEFTCSRCCNDFIVETCVLITYSTYKKDEKK